MFFFNKRGSVMLMTFYVMSSLVLIGASFLVLMINERLSEQRTRYAAQSYHIAEAGIERAINDLRIDYNASRDFNDGNINGVTVGPNMVDFYDIYPAVSFAGGNYLVQLKNVGVSNHEVWIKSKGTVGEVSQTILVYINMIDLSGTWTVNVVSWQRVL